MNNIVYLDYTSLKQRQAVKMAPWQYIDNGDSFSVFFQDGVVVYETIIYKATTSVKGLNASTEAANLSDFQTNIQPIANGATHNRDGSGISMMSTAPFTDPKNIETRLGIFANLDASTTVMQWTIPYPYIQLQGVRFDIKNTEAGDKITTVEIGYYLPNSTWVSVEAYGFNIYFTGGDYNLVADALAKSTPVPQGLTIKFTYQHANPATLIVKPCAITFNFWRPYGT